MLSFQDRLRVPKAELAQSNLFFGDTPGLLIHDNILHITVHDFMVSAWISVLQQKTCEPIPLQLTWMCFLFRSQGGTWKLADFGLATRFNRGSYMTGEVGTQPFMAPEVEQRHYTEKCDIYSRLPAVGGMESDVHPWSLFGNGPNQCI